MGRAGPRVMPGTIALDRAGIVCAIKPWTSGAVSAKVWRSCPRDPGCLLLDRTECHDRAEERCGRFGVKEHFARRECCDLAPEIDMPRIAALVVLLVLSPSIALAQGIPEYDTQAHCERVAENAAKPSAALEGCLWLEEYALDELETFWPRASNAVREECLEATSGEESYVILARCVMARLRRSR